MLSTIVLLLSIASSTFVPALAETHTVTFDNKCGFGTPILKGQDGTTLSTGDPYTIEGPLQGAIAWLQYDNKCGENGEYCTTIEATLYNGYSSSDITLISPHEFSVTTGFGYYDTCSGAGANCASADCSDAFHESDQNWVQVGCSVDDVNLSITFCE
ncbi:hypothetical protein WOLCODRAFT_97211 [Wolfiporia cocos MD-104 SS10]|uniref:Glycopeptide n=1 Tax=Wolfiporia cocos (strain MD-104) TaxID=742152 RepID=A0A2H3JIA0_WOLCO|nr:hypothetical protein WOLCODRAFT_97211 [Wolfiporia cocos MD-104 SS10]